ncbi:MAG: phospholipid carrier-dependent glycosyltransferase [Ignavibacteriales bacterium]|nr:phospholipid carrier-dependent glycosyltransferase [Ignavibacteriales bacterium]
MPSSTDRTPKISWDLIIAAAILLGVYFVLVWAHDGFGLADFNYFSSSGPYMLNIPTPFVRSQFWKILILLPATVLASVAMSRSGLRFRFPMALNYRLAVGSLMLIAATVLVFSTQYLLHETEVTDDENTFDFQAHTLLLGRVVNPPPPVVESFHNVFIINDGKQWVGKYTLGHPLIIAIGMALGNRYCLTITLSVLTLLLVYLISLKIYGDRKVALLTLCLGAISPFFYLVSSSRLSHTTTAFFLALFMYLFLQSRSMSEKKHGGTFIAFLAGLALGYAFNVRSLTALGFVAPFCVVAVIDVRQQKPGTLLRGLFLTAGFALVVGITLWYNAIVTGNALTFPFHYYNSAEELGFGAFGHTFLASVRNLGVSIGRLNGVFLGFPLSFLFLFAVLFDRKGFGDYVSFGILGGIAVAYLFYYSPGVSDLGPVYYYETMIPLLLLSARAVVSLHRLFTDHFSHGNALVPNFLVLSGILALVTYVPEQISHVHRLTDQIREPYEVVRSANVQHGLVLIKSRMDKGWVFGYRNPSPDFTENIIYARYADTASNLALTGYFRDRMPYILDRDSSKARWRLVAVDRATLQPLPLQ